MIEMWGVAVAAPFFSIGHPTLGTKVGSLVVDGDDLYRRLTSALFRDAADPNLAVPDHDAPVAHEHILKSLCFDRVLHALVEDRRVLLF